MVGLPPVGVGKSTRKDEMLRIHFTAEDIARTTLRADPDPLWEALLSLHMLQVGSGSIPYGTWRRQVRQRLPQEVVGPLAALAPPVGYSPDFLTPSVGSASFGDAVEMVLSTPRERIRTDLARLAPRTRANWLHHLAEARVEAMRSLGDSMRAYHRSALEPYWPAIERAVHADHRQRRSQLIDGGIGAVLEGIHPEARWRNGVLEIAAFRDAELWLDGRGLQLQPSYFCWQQPTKLLDTDLPPVLVFPIRGANGLMRAKRQEADSNARVAGLLGKTRAIMLARTVTGATTTDLAAAGGVSLGTASYQTIILRESGLIETERNGRYVVHRASELGRALLDGASPDATHRRRQP